MSGVIQTSLIAQEPCLITSEVSINSPQAGESPPSGKAHEHALQGMEVCNIRGTGTGRT